jgi:hypothetical protein
MRWVDIDLRRPSNAEARRHLEAAASTRHELPGVQERHGPDSPAAVALMAEVGSRLFRAVTAVDPFAFASDRDRTGGIDPRVGVAETDHLVGYHLIVPPELLNLPWSWLHNGVDFLLVHHPIAAATAGSDPAARRASAWTSRHRDARFAQEALGAQPLTAWLDQMRPAGRDDPEILFLAGHCEEAVRPLLYREADAIRGALAASPLQRALARLAVPDQAVTPDDLRRRGASFQGFHFAGPTARPPSGSAETAWEYLASVGAASGDATGAGDLEYVGVDGITAMLDELSERAEREEQLDEPKALAGVGAAADGAPGASAAGAGEPAAPHGSAAAAVPQAGGSWLLEDGPIRPEELARVGGAPPLVFSNSYLSLQDLGRRFLEAGASTFVGPTAAVMSRPAREFAARFYSCLAEGYCAAAALRSAALACRERHGAESPIWLSYGLIGYGSLALQYL